MLLLVIVIIVTVANHFGVFARDFFGLPFHLFVEPPKIQVPMP